MSVLFASLLAAAAPAALPDDEIVVLARRLETISAQVVRDQQGRYHCALNELSGDQKLDGQLCKTATKCVRKGKIDNDAIGACVDRAKPKLLADFKLARRAGS